MEEGTAGYTVDYHQEGQDDVSPEIPYTKLEGEGDSETLLQEDELEDFKDQQDVDAVVEGVKRRGTLLSSSMNLCNTIIGGGVSLMSLPLVSPYVGWPLGQLSVIIMGILSFETYYLLVKSADIAKKNSFHELAEVAMGSLGPYVILISIFLNNFGVCIAFLAFFSDVLPCVMADLNVTGFWSHRLTLMTVVSILVAPICIVKSIDKIGRVSYLCLLFIGIFLVTMVSRAVHTSIDNGISTDQFFHMELSWTKALRVVPVISFAFTCHFQVLPVKNELKNPTPSRTLATLVCCTVFATTIYCIEATAAWLTFYGDINGNIINNYSERNWWSITCQVCFSLSVILTYPLFFWGARNSIDVIFFPNVRTTRLRRICWTSVLVPIILAISYALTLVGGVDFIVSLIGAGVAAPINFIYPSIFYMSVKKGWDFHKVVSYFLLAFGVISCLVGLTLTIADVV